MQPPLTIHDDLAQYLHRLTCYPDLRLPALKVFDDHVDIFGIVDWRYPPSRHLLMLHLHDTIE